MNVIMKPGDILLPLYGASINYYNNRPFMSVNEKFISKMKPDGTWKREDGPAMIISSPLHSEDHVLLLLSRERIVWVNYCDFMLFTTLKYSCKSLLRYVSFVSRRKYNGIVR